MAHWHHLEHKRTGETQVVASLDGIDLKLWEAVPIAANRAPSEFQIVESDGTLRTDAERKGASDKVGAANRLSRVELVERIEALERAVAQLLAQREGQPE